MASSASLSWHNSRALCASAEKSQQSAYHSCAVVPAGQGDEPLLSATELLPRCEASAPFMSHRVRTALLAVAALGFAAVCGAFGYLACVPHELNPAADVTSSMTLEQDQKIRLQLVDRAGGQGAEQGASLSDTLKGKLRLTMQAADKGASRSEGHDGSEELAVVPVEVLIPVDQIRPHYKGFGNNPPDYPLPYLQGEWPQSYEYKGQFPAGFVWGVGTAALQIEGSYRADGRGASIWDTFTGADTVGMPGADCSYCCKQAPCQPSDRMTVKGATPNVACDHYHNYKADVALMKSMGLRNYRFSLSWPRLIPTGRFADGVNDKGVAFYNQLIDELLSNGIEPYVTLYHWDLPQGLLDPPSEQAWWSRDEQGRPNGKILPDWLEYVNLAFEKFGDRVKFWATFNEPWTFTWLASGWGKAPSIEEFNDMSVDPLIAGHNVLLAHAAAVDLYRSKFLERQQGQIGITLNCDWREPKTDDPQDVAAAERAVLFTLGWFAEPIYGRDGDYPVAMRELFGDKLPNFTQAQKKLLKGSADYFGFNHYGTAWASYAETEAGASNDFAHMEETGFVQGQSSWLFGSAWGFRKLLNWISRRYNHPAMYVTESGWSVAAKGVDEGVRDRERTFYYANYTSEMRKAIAEDNLDIRGYFVWSLMDNFEWDQGYNERFGITFNDYKFADKSTGLEPSEGQQVRTRKDSSCWLEAVWRRNQLVDPLSFNCEGAEVFEGSFTVDSANTSSDCSRRIVMADSREEGHIQGATCLGENDTDWTASAEFSGTSIVAELPSATGGNSSRLAGFWNHANRVIFWEDGSVWTKEDAILQAK